jgi:hypothetical protein
MICRVHTSALGLLFASAVAQAQPTEPPRNEGWSFVAGGGAIVVKQGSETQFTAGLFLGYKV